MSYSKKLFLIQKQLSEAVAIQALLDIEEQLPKSVLFTNSDKVVLLKKSVGSAFLIYSNRSLVGIALALPLSEAKELLDRSLAVPSPKVDKEDELYVSLLLPVSYDVDVCNHELIVGQLMRTGRELGLQSGCAHIVQAEMSWDMSLPNRIKSKKRKKAEVDEQQLVHFEV